MADNELTGDGKAIATRKVTYSGDAAQNAQVIGLVGFSGSDDAKTADDIGGDAANGLDVDVTRLPGIAGTVAHDGVDSGNPVKVGGRAITDLAGATMVSAADRADILTDLDSVQLVKPFVPFNNILSERVTDTGGTSTALTTFGATASARNMVTTIILYNDSATDGFVDIRDGTAGSVIATIPLPSKGGAVVPFPVPLRQPTVNTALAYDVSAALTTVYLTFVGFKSKA